MKRLSLIMLLVFILTILISEVYLRIFYYEQLKTRQTSTNRIPGSLVVFNRKPNTEEAYITPEVNNTFRSNNMGYIGPDFNVTKTPGSFRIIIVGNSVTVGMQKKGANNFCIFLQKQFYNNKMNIEVINCGREGWTKDVQNLYIIKEEIIHYHPDLVLLENHGRLLYKRYVYEGYRNYTLEYDPGRP